jgi:hypothetical protein
MVTIWVETCHRCSVFLSIFDVVCLTVYSYWTLRQQNGMDNATIRVNCWFKPIFTRFLTFIPIPMVYFTPTRHVLPLCNHYRHTGTHTLHSLFVFFLLLLLWGRWNLAYALQPFEAYCTNPVLVPPFISRGAPRQTAWETSISERRNLWARNGPSNLAQQCDSHVILRFFYMPQSCDVRQTALLPFRRKTCWGIFRPKNPTGLRGLETSNLGTRGQRADH